VKFLFDCQTARRPCEPPGPREARPDDRLRGAIRIFSAGGGRNGVTRVRIPAARIARVLRETCPRKMEGAGKTGCQPHPWPRVQQKARELGPQVPPNQPGLPCAMVLTVSCVLSPVSQTLLSPSSVRCASIVANLAPALGRQDHTPSPSATVFRKSRPADLVPVAPKLWRRRISVIRLLTPPRPSHPALNVRDDREAPLLTSAGRRG